MWIAVAAMIISTVLTGVLLLGSWPDPGRRATYNGIVVGKETEFQIDITYGGETVYVLMLDVGRPRPIGRLVPQDLYDRARHGDRVIKLPDAQPVLVRRRR
ncbi:hypothetical protein [Actinoplanes sp. NPDC049681]|uniref:hypothetical protein n=1 Tax=Actinoplanes sp. NPDC049681 TaxID=3363905 RepID=UPI0037B20725